MTRHAWTPIDVAQALASLRQPDPAAILYVHIPGPPQALERARSSRGHHYTPERSRRYQEAAAPRVVAAMAQTRWEVGGKGPFALTVLVKRQRALGDLDNFVKMVADVFTKAGVWADDRYVHQIQARFDQNEGLPGVKAWVQRL
jgi:Holliday junction resolvase RusA-like endonuclease